jgi:hypothetical protein
LSANRLLNGKLDLLDNLKFLIDDAPLPSTANGSAHVLKGLDSSEAGMGKKLCDEESVESAMESLSIQESTLHLAVLGSAEDAQRLVDAECKL